MRNHMPRSHRSALISAAWFALTLLFGVVMVAQPLERRAGYATAMLNITSSAFLLTVCLLVLYGILRLMKVNLPLVIYPGLALFAAISFLGIYGAGAAASRLSLQLNHDIRIGADSLAIHGAIPADLANTIDRLLLPSFSPSRVELTSHGGSVLAALDTADVLRRRGTRLAVIQGDCASACAILALSMPERYLAPGGALGFHEISALATGRNELAEEREMMLLRFAHNGVSPELLRPLFQGRKMRYPDRDWLLDNKLLTGCWDTAKQLPTTC